MQSVISRTALTFVEDAVALTGGFARILRDLTMENFDAVRSAVMAPINRLARACDVAGVLDARDRPAPPPLGPRRPRLGRRKTLALRMRKERRSGFGFPDAFSCLRSLGQLT